MIYSPFEQFNVTNLNKINNIDQTNSIYITDTFIICINIILFYTAIYLVLSFSNNKRSILLSTFVGIYSFVYDNVKTYLPLQARIYFPFFMYVFIWICTSNLIGILPYSFTLTSHLTITFALAFMIWFSTIIIGFQINGLRFFSSWYPQGIPFMLTPFLVLIEIISYIFRPVSLSLRLFANIVAGHILLDTIALFIYKTVVNANGGIISILLSVIPFFMCIVLMVFEIAVALLQGYIFVVLSRIYLKDSYNVQSH